LIDSPGVGYYIQVLTAACKVNFNTTAYATNTTINIYTDTATRVQHVFSNGLNATLSRIAVSAQQGINGAADTQLISDKGVYLKTQTTSPTAGDSDIIIYLTYRIIQE
jgi:predicted methyltransferase